MLVLGSVLSGAEEGDPVRIQEVQAKDPGGGAKLYELPDGRPFWVVPEASHIGPPDVVFVKKLTVGGDPCVELNLSADGQKFIGDAGRNKVSMGLFLQGALVSVPWVPGGLYAARPDVIVSLNKGEGKKVQ